jgi:PhnB protein
MKLTTNLDFDGQCREAFERYAELLGGQIMAMFTYDDLPEMQGMAEEQRGRIAHAWLQIGDQALMGGDAAPGYVQPVGGFSVCVHVDSLEEARRLFDGLSEGGRATVPLGETSWSPAFGMLTDRFGTPWMVNVAPPAPAQS